MGEGGVVCLLKSRKALFFWVRELGRQSGREEGANERQSVNDTLAENQSSHFNGVIGKKRSRRFVSFLPAC